MPAPSKNYTLIPDASIDADSPLDTTLITQIRDNFIHIEEWLGDSFTAAKDHNHDGVNSASATVADGSILQIKLGYAAGDNLLVGADTEGFVGITSWILKKEIKIGRISALRIKFDLHGTGGYTARGQIWKNGVAVGTDQGTSSPTYITFSQDISGWVPGDLIQLYISNSTGGSAYYRNFRLYISDADQLITLNT